MTATRRCACGCGASLDDLRADAVYSSGACSKRARREASPDKGRTRSIADVRREQEEAKTRWSMIVREGILEVLGRAPHLFHADDLEPLGIPDEHRNIIGSQVAKLVNQKWIVECGRRKSTIATRNGAKSNEYRLTELGRDRVLAGVRGDDTSGEALGLGAATPTRPHAVTTDPGGDSSADTRHARGPARPDAQIALVPEPPRHDSEERAA